MCPPTTCSTERSASCQALNLSCLPRRRPLAMATFRRSATRGCEVIRCTARGASAPTRLRPSLVFLHRLCCYGRSGGSLARAKGATIWRSIRTSRTLSGDAFSLATSSTPRDDRRRGPLDRLSLVAGPVLGAARAGLGRPDRCPGVTGSASGSLGSRTSAGGSARLRRASRSVGDTFRAAASGAWR